MKQLFTIFAFVLFGLIVNAQYIYNDFDANQNEPFSGENNDQLLLPILTLQVLIPVPMLPNGFVVKDFNGHMFLPNLMEKLTLQPEQLFN